MIRDTAVAVNATSTPPPVPQFHRWRCPLCGGAFRHPWHLAEHLAKPAPGGIPHGRSGDDAWAIAASVAPVDMTPGLDRYPTVPAIPMAGPPTAARKAVAHAG